MAVLLVSLLAAAPAGLLLLTGLVPSAIADRHPRRMRNAVVRLAALAFTAAVATAGLLGLTGPVDRALWEAPRPLPFNIGVFVDSLTAVMLLLIGFVGLVIARFSARALEGEPQQGRFFGWLALTLGAVLTLVVSRNLVMFTGAWMLTSYGLHQLLMHYPDRPWAVWAARKKFLISRLGDGLLLAALSLTFWCFGSGDYAVIFQEADAARSSTAGLDPCLAAIGMLLVLGAMTKSAQFPFHSWLPDTMEAPTPVSALMHAGIINAGGFLVIRLSPVISLSHAALDVLAFVGAVTALFGGLVMLTQTSIKRSLAFSTIAQMGFMMLQCGLGAFGAALLHIVAHSLYKAHAFLSAGSVLDAAAKTQLEAPPGVGGMRGLKLLPLGMALAAVIAAAGGVVVGLDLTTKPGGAVLLAVMGIALTTLVWQSLLTGSWPVALGGMAAAGGVSVAYAAAALGMERLLAWSAVADASGPASACDIVVGVVVVAGFLGVFMLQAAAAMLARWPVIRALHVHAANGLYCDIPARQITARVWGLSTPVP
jgi:NAD(P)H-quinone oxidoreductase subunit 5